MISFNPAICLLYRPGLTLVCFLCLEVTFFRCAYCWSASGTTPGFRAAVSRSLIYPGSSERAPLPCLIKVINECVRLVTFIVALAWWSPWRLVAFFSSYRTVFHIHNWMYGCVSVRVNAVSLRFPGSVVVRSGNTGVQYGRETKWIGGDVTCGGKG